MSSTLLDHGSSVGVFAGAHDEGERPKVCGPLAQFARGLQVPKFPRSEIRLLRPHRAPNRHLGFFSSSSPMWTACQVDAILPGGTEEGASARRASEAEEPVEADKEAEAQAPDQGKLGYEYAAGQRTYKRAQSWHMA